MTTRTPRRRRQWQDFIINENTPNTSQDNANLTGGVITETKGLTIVRMIIGMNVRALTPAINSVNDQLVAMGIGIFTADAISSQVFPDPETGDDQPGTGWLWRWQGLVGEDPTNAVRFDLDIRSMRKIMYGGARLIISNDPAFGTAFEIETLGLIKVLYLLP